jgi:hypothetical protein
MKKLSWLLLVAVISTLGSIGIAGAKACPPTSKNPGGTPPNCGHSTQPPPPPATTCSKGGLGGNGTILNKDKNENGQLSKPIHQQVEPAVGPLGPTVVHEVNCDVVVTLGL